MKNILNNDQLTQNMIDILKEKMERDYEKGSTKRDAHPKTLGLVKGHVKIMDNIPENLKTGIFKEPKEYKAWLRFSNSKGTIKSDKIKDFRGVGIKLIDVKGPRVTNTENHTQDFLLMTNPTMPLGTVQIFHDAVYYSIVKGPLRMLMHFILTGNGKLLKEMSKNKKFDTSPLDISYWSTTPYKCGDTFVKYKLVPRNNYVSTLPKPLTDNYLTDNMQSHLEKEAAVFDFFVQSFVDEHKTPIENASILWDESDAPLIKVAEIIIPKQQFNNKVRAQLSEDLSFSPGNSLTVHGPAGELNIARTTIYEALSNFRHSRDARSRYEPTVEDFDRY